MKSRREHSGLKVQFESSPSPDLFSNGESEVPGSRVSAPADWSAECKVRPREELAVESECPDVVDCNGEDSMGVVKCGGCGEAESEIRELRGKVQLLEKTLKEVLDSTRLGTQMTGLPRRHPGPRTSNCFKCGKSGHTALDGLCPTENGKSGERSREIGPLGCCCCGRMGWGSQSVPGFPLAHTHVIELRLLYLPPPL